MPKKDRDRNRNPNPIDYRDRPPSSLFNTRKDDSSILKFPDKELSQTGKIDLSTKYKIPTTDTILKVWNDGIEMDDNSFIQLEETARTRVVQYIAMMADGHFGKGASVGTVLATNVDVIIPATVGVDIGCGMVALKTNITVEELPDNLRALKESIDRAIPVGSGPSKKQRIKSQWHEDKIPDLVAKRWNEELKEGYDKIIEINPKIGNKNNVNQLGTLGSGNHFIEICGDEEHNVWIMLHSGSRGTGNRIGNFFITKAKEFMLKNYIEHTVDNDFLSYLVDDKNLKKNYFREYIEAMMWAQDYARINREVMTALVYKEMQKFIPHIELTDMAVNCHHNYCSYENMFGKNLIITRKGAVRLREGEKAVIPGSMGANSYIVEGLGNENSMFSGPHGAGRRLGRNEARRIITEAEHKKALADAGVIGNDGRAFIDESPAAYKDIKKVINAHRDCLRVLYILRPIINIKG